MLRSAAVALAALAATALIFAEYLPPIMRVIIPYDLNGYHYPLLDYAFQELRQGRFPAWDASSYSGIPLAANVQTALFYPPTWLMFLADWGRERLRYVMVEIFVVLHFWLAFLMAYAWLRSRRLHALACALGGAVMAFSGYMMTQAQHQGLVTAFAWWPLGFWGLDDAAAGHWRRGVLKVAAASALVFLCGYTPLWVVYAFVLGGYALGCARRPAAVLAVGGGVLLSLTWAAVQLLPAMEAAGLMFREARYGNGYKTWAFFATYLFPNFWNYSFDAPHELLPGLDYWYLGAPGIACMFLAWRGRKHLRPMLAALAVAAVFIFNPFGWVSAALSRPSLFSNVIRDWYFLAAITAAAALLAAVGADAWLRRTATARTSWIAAPVCAAMLAWCVYLLRVWAPGGSEFVHGWPSSVYTAVGLLLALAALWTYATVAVRARQALGAALLLLALCEYKAFGTSKRFNADSPELTRGFSRGQFTGFDNAHLDLLRAAPTSRIAITLYGPFPGDLRHFQFHTPQGFDPLLPQRYRELLSRHGQFNTDRELRFDLADRAGLDLLGVRYVITAERAAEYPWLSDAANGYRLAGPPTSYYKLFERAGAQPSYGWDKGSTPISVILWTPQHRAFAVTGPGKFRLAEQFYPGWRAFIDGAEAPLERCHLALQCVDVPAGAHRLEFRFRSGTLLAGAGVSALSLLLSIAFLARKPKS